MSLAWRTVACLALALLAGGAPPPPKDDAVGPNQQLRPGMTPVEVRKLLGPPQRVARQVLYHRYLEQWVYDAPAPVRVEFDCPSGQPARLVSVTSDGN
jgi:hypothetical protein